VAVTAPAVARLALAAEPPAWAAAGFRVEGGSVTVGGVVLGLRGADAGRGIVDCALRGVGERPALDGLPLSAALDGQPVQPATPHPNGVRAIDHLVAFTPDLDRTVAAARALGLDLRRIRDEPAPAGSPRQAFFRLGELMLEVAQAPHGSPLAPDSPARFYGLAFVADDLDATAHAPGLVGAPRDAVQPGRRIATYRRGAALGLPVALMTPRS